LINIPNYDISIYWSVEDKCYLAEVPDLPGCMADGKSLTEAAQNIEIIIHEWIECAIEDGDSIPIPNNRLLTA
jgi:predicted RNase H-like HicB family nuclease